MYIEKIYIVFTDYGGDGSHFEKAFKREECAREMVLKYNKKNINSFTLDRTKPEERTDDYYININSFGLMFYEEKTLF